MKRLAVLCAVALGLTIVAEVRADGLCPSCGAHAGPLHPLGHDANPERSLVAAQCALGLFTVLFAGRPLCHLRLNHWKGITMNTKLWLGPLLGLLAAASISQAWYRSPAFKTPL